MHCPDRRPLAAASVCSSPHLLMQGPANDGDSRAAGDVPAAADNPGPTARDDAGGFRNVLPPGQNGLDTPRPDPELSGYRRLPKHWADQQPLYDGLLYASPTLTDSQVRTTTRTRPSA